MNTQIVHGVTVVPDARVRAASEAWKRQASGSRLSGLLVGLVVGAFLFAVNQFKLQAGTGVEIHPLVWAVILFGLCSFSQSVTAQMWKMGHPRPVSLDEYNREAKVRCELQADRQRNPWWARPIC